jgi:Fe-S cluster biogenesis protein NfuA
MMGEPQTHPGETERSFEQQIESALEKIRLALQADGGDIELVAVEGPNARVRLVGACGG